MKIQRVVLVSAYYPPHLGGQEIAVQELATQLAAAGTDVEVVTSDIGAEAGSRLEDGVRVTRLRSWEVGHTAIVWGLLWWLVRNVSRDAIVHLHVGQAFTPEITWLAARLRRFKYVVQMHIEPAKSGSLGVLLPIYSRVLLSRALRSADHVIVLNESHRQILRDRYSRNENVSVMPNGVADEFFANPRSAQRRNTGAVRLVFVGRLSPQKNLSALIEAIASTQTDVVLHIVGDGECRRALQDVVSRMGPTNVRMHGRLSRAEVRKFYSECDAFVLPSLYEAQPIALLEAIASRIPVIATNVIGVGAAFGAAAIVVEPTVQGLADGIDRFAGLPAAGVDQLVDQAFKIAKTHEWNRVITKYIDLYRLVSSGSPDLAGVARAGVSGEACDDSRIENCARDLS